MLKKCKCECVLWIHLIHFFLFFLFPSLSRSPSHPFLYLYSSLCYCYMRASRLIPLFLLLPFAIELHTSAFMFSVHFLNRNVCCCLLFLFFFYIFIFPIPICNACIEYLHTFTHPSTAYMLVRVTTIITLR